MESSENNAEVGERLETLETVIDELRAQNSTILLQLDQLVRNSKSQPNPSTQPNSGVPPPSTSIPSSTSTKNKIKPASPPDFDGDRSKGRAFLLSCELYIDLVPDQFTTPRTAIYWALSFMKSGRASLFAQRVIRHQTKSGTPKFADWTAFRKQFIEEFCPKNEVQLALAKLETSTYHQNRKTVDDYIDEFRELIDQAGYREGLAIVVKFRKGLNREIQDQIAQLPFGRPDDDDPEEWYQAAVRAEENRTANNLFHGGSRATPVNRPAVSSMGTPTRSPGFSWVPRSQMAPQPRTNTASTPAPVDNDSAQKKRDFPDVCRRCGKTGHWVKNCPRQFDIRYMTLGERHEWIQDVNAEIDVEEARQTETEAEQETEEAPKDFPESSG